MPNPPTFPVIPSSNFPAITQTQTQKLVPLAPGNAGVRQTLGHMREFVNAYKTHPAVRNTAIALTRGLDQKDYIREAQALFNFVHGAIRYTRDVSDIETLQTPLVTLSLIKAGDCDDKSTLLAALLESIGFKTRFLAMGFPGRGICHVTTQASINGKWVNMDTTEPRPMGWLPNGISESIINESREIAGLGSLWDSIKSVGRVLDDKVLQKVTQPLKPVLKQKWVGQLGTVVSFVPGFGVFGTGLSLANKASVIHSIGDQQAALARVSDAKARAALKADYGMKPNGQFFPLQGAAKTTYTGQRFKIDPVSNTMYPIDANGDPELVDDQGNPIPPARIPASIKILGLLAFGGLSYYIIRRIRSSH